MALDRDTTFTWYGHACVEVATPGGKTDLLDFTQATPNNFGDPALAVGQTWVDPYTDLTITVNGVVTGGLNVTVTYNTPPCTAAAPTISISPSSTSRNVMRREPVHPLAPILIPWKASVFNTCRTGTIPNRKPLANASNSATT